MGSQIFQASDLTNQRRIEFLDAARSGGARLRHKDGTSLVMLPESRLVWLETMNRWSAVHLRLEELIRRGVMPSIGDLGDLAWLRAFDFEDLGEFVGELHEALVVANADQDPARLEECVAAWRLTARQLEDPLRRRVLLGDRNDSDFVDAPRPEQPEQPGAPGDDE